MSISLFRRRFPTRPKRSGHQYQIKLLAGSKLFDSTWYRQQYRAPATGIENAYEHYLHQGATEGRNPGPDFDGNWYLQRYPDVAAAGQNPLIHYIEHGEAEGREIRSVILAEQARPQPEGLQHSIEILTKSNLFDPEWYLREYPDVAAAGENPAVHYLVFGAAEGRNPGPEFDGSWYLKCNTDVAAAGLNPLLHYLEAGIAEGREIRRVIRANALETKLNSRFSELKALRTFLIPAASRRLTVVLEGEDLGCAGRAEVAVILAALLAQHMGASLRFAMPALPDASMFADIWRANAIRWSGEVEFVQIGFDDYSDVGVSENDFFLTTSWKTTWSARSSVNPRRIIYLLQDDERRAYPFGDDRLRCQEILADPELLYMVVSETLFEHFTSGSTAIESIRRRGAWFERAIPIEPYPPSSNWKIGGVTRNFLFDARQSSIGNLYWRGLEVIQKALEERLFKGYDWDFYFLSNSTDDIVLPGDIHPSILTTLHSEDGRHIFSRMDVGLCLTETPCLNYPILELVANGGVVVTNRRRIISSFARYSDNILCSDSSINSLTRGLVDAIRLATDDEKRSTNYFRQQIARDWTVALEPALGRITLLAGIEALQRC